MNGLNLRHFRNCAKWLMLAPLALTIVMLSGNAVAEPEIVVVTGKDSPIGPLSREEVAALFLGKRKYSHDIAITPLDSKDSALRELFYLATTDMSPIRLKAYWSRIVFFRPGSSAPGSISHRC